MAVQNWLYTGISLNGTFMSIYIRTLLFLLLASQCVEVNPGPRGKGRGGNPYNNNQADRGRDRINSVFSSQHNITATKSAAEIVSRAKDYDIPIESQRLTRSKSCNQPTIDDWFGHTYENGNTSDSNPHMIETNDKSE